MNNGEEKEAISSKAKIRAELHRLTGFMFKGMAEGLHEMIPSTVVEALEETYREEVNTANEILGKPKVFSGPESKG